MTIANDGDGDHDASVSPDSDEPAETAPAGFSVEGRVLDDADGPCSSAVVSIIAGPARHADIAAVTDVRGAFSLSVQGAGIYTLAVRIDGVLRQQIEIAVPAPETATLEIRLSR